MVSKDALGVHYIDEQFKDSCPPKGPPAESSARLALVAVLQFAAGLTDRQAADVCASHTVGMTDSKFASCSGVHCSAAGTVPAGGGGWRSRVDTAI